MSQTRLLSVLVENRPGVLQRVSSMIRRRGFNIDSLSVGPTEDGDVSRMTIAVSVGRQQAEQATRQLAKLIDVISIDDITGQPAVSHELLLARLHAPGSQRREILDILEIFRGRVVDVASSSLIVEVTGSAEKLVNFLDLMRPFGIKEVARSGMVSLVRGDDARLRVIELDDEGTQELGVPSSVAGLAGTDMTGDV